MNSTYNLEPPSTAEVRLHTTAGAIDLELFGKQTPLATRNFLQLCMNGYYDGTIFHRIVPEFILQGGDPTGTGEGGEAIYDGGVFEDELHSRLRFNRRGLLGMANTGPNDNGSQFFITLDKAEELTGKNTMFGRVVGDSIYIVAKLAEGELIEGSDRPVYPGSIIRTEVVLNPYSDMVAQKVEKKQQPSAGKEATKRKTKKKAGKTLLSFEDGEEGEQSEPLLKKPKFNPKLVKAEENPSNTVAPPRQRVPHSDGKRPGKQRSLTPPPKATMKLHKDPQRQFPLRDEEVPSAPSSSSPEPEDVRRVSSALERTNAQIAELKASMKRNVQNPAMESTREASALERMIPKNVIRGRKRKQNNATQGDLQALKMLDAFRTKLEEASERTEDKDVAKKASAGGPPVTTTEADRDKDEEAALCDLHFIANCESCRSWDNDAVAEEDDINDKDSWLTHALTFEKDRLGKDLNWKKRNEDDLVVIDPREKAKGIEDERKAKRLAQKGGSRAWDRDRDRGRAPEKLAGARG